MSLNGRMFSLGLAVCIAATLPVAASAQSSSPAQRDPNRVAYGYALRCVATAAGVRTDPRSTPTQKGAADASYERAYNAAMRLGGVLGLSGQHVGDDLAATVRVEAALQLRDPAYFRQSQADCARLGL